ncbi:MAG: hypothetical protein EF813_07175 [Methanosarcinales archaeon]|nr:MAG: hypothetical protein EF813_07175 [Methanosarcinales archaeon]
MHITLPGVCRIDPHIRELACNGMPVPDHRSSHPTVRVRFRIPPPESLRSSGGSCATERRILAYFGVLGASLPPSGTAVS